VGKIRVVLADDREEVIARIRGTLGDEFEVIEAVANGNQAVIAVLASRRYWSGCRLLFGPNGCGAASTHRACRFCSRERFFSRRRTGWSLTGGNWTDNHGGYMSIDATPANKAASIKSTNADPIKSTGGLVSDVRVPGSDVRAYKDIRFAKAPVGDLRWRPPQPADPWTGVLVADKFGAVPMQIDEPNTNSLGAIL
jgi:CheY-like chemotaxis protein